MIPFPKLHIAESALNRIFNALDGELQSFNPPMEPPIVPDATGTGTAVETALAQPPAPASVPPENQEISNASAMESVLNGGSAFNGALMGSMY